MSSADRHPLLDARPTVSQSELRDVAIVTMHQEGVSGREIARRVGVSEFTVRHVLKGKRGRRAYRSAPETIAAVKRALEAQRLDLAVSFSALASLCLSILLADDGAKLRKMSGPQLATIAGISADKVAALAQQQQAGGGINAVIVLADQRARAWIARELGLTPEPERGGPGMPVGTAPAGDVPVIDVPVIDVTPEGTPQ